MVAFGADRHHNYYLGTKQKYIIGTGNHESIPNQLLYQSYGEPLDIRRIRDEAKVEDNQIMIELLVYLPSKGLCRFTFAKNIIDSNIIHDEVGARMFRLRFSLRADFSSNTRILMFGNAPPINERQIKNYDYNFGLHKFVLIN